MTDKLEALSQPVFEIEVSGNTWLNCSAENLTPTERADFSDWPDGINKLYSQEYVTALIQRAVAAEQREEHLKASVDVLSAKNAELEQQLSRTNSMLSESIAALKAAEEQIEQLKRAKL
ncbi:hypothetical protein AV650_15310 [Serratia fonticola]|nr:hypothetical protein AV650_15310 [Serratia fonticola]